ncbi:MAG: hypothetical protein ACRC5G_00050 [Cetobacterium sp.]
MKLLSIDLDWLFLDCPEYQKYMDHCVDWETSWRVVRAYQPKNNFDPCEKSMAYLKHILHNCCNGAKVDIIEEHDEILNIMRDNKYENIELVNFDHHHDISYGEDDHEENLENWVTFAKKEDIIKDYVWIHQDNSKLCHHGAFNYLRESWKDTPLSLFEKTKFDHVVICISKHFTPPEYHHLAVELKGEIKYKI